MTVQFDYETLNRFRDLKLETLQDARLVMRELKLLDKEIKSISKEVDDVYKPLELQTKAIIKDMQETQGFNDTHDMQGIRFKYTEKEKAVVSNPEAFYKMVLSELAKRVVGFDEENTAQLRLDFMSHFNYDMIACLIDLTRPYPTDQMTEEQGVTKITTTSLTVTPRPL